MKDVGILVIDDSEIDRYILVRQLKQAGISNVFEYSDGSHALAFLHEYEKNKQAYPDKFPPIVIFLDINMPLVGGFEFLESFEKLKDKYDFLKSIIVMYSSSDNPSDHDKAYSYDSVVDFLVKGQFTPDTVREKLEKLLAD